MTEPLLIARSAHADCLLLPGRANRHGLITGATGTGKTVTLQSMAEAFARIESESVDYAVMENTARAAMVPVAMGWSDIGNWKALHAARGRDAQGNAVRGPAERLLRSVFTLRPWLAIQSKALSARASLIRRWTRGNWRSERLSRIRRPQLL